MSQSLHAFQFLHSHKALHSLGASSASNGSGEESAVEYDFLLLLKLDRVSSNTLSAASTLSCQTQSGYH
jgi:hypothetical protein